MKKNISINLQGLIFHIEEDGYDILSRYLAEVKAHFARFRGHQDIVADIESRMAEIFSLRLSPTKQVITLADVEEMQAKMGRVSDFADVDTDEDDADFATADAASAAGTASGRSFGPEDFNRQSAGFGSGPSASSFGNGPATSDPAAAEEPRRLYRDTRHGKIAGVAAGLGHYFKVNPVWIRLAFVALLLLRPIFLSGFDFDGDNTHFDGLNLSGLALIVYAILWIVLPKRDDAPEPIVTLSNSGPWAGRRLFRDVDSGKIGGVAAGLAHYFQTDVVLVRVLLLVGIFVGGISFFLYPILWVAVPVARTVSEKLQMRGDDVTLAGIASSLDATQGQTESNAANSRPLGQFLEGAAKGATPLLNTLGTIIRWGVAALLLVMGIGFLAPLVGTLIAALGILPAESVLHFGDNQQVANALFRSIPDWGVLAGFLALGIPTLALFLLAYRLVFRRPLLGRNGSLVLLSLWILSVVVALLAASKVTNEFQESGTAELSTPLGRSRARTFLLDSRNTGEYLQYVDLRFAPADSGTAGSVDVRYRAKGRTTEAARLTAAASVAYGFEQRPDSVLRFDEGIMLKPGAPYRDQDATVTLRLPVDKVYLLTPRFIERLDDGDFTNNYQPRDHNPHRARFTAQGQFECLDCPAPPRDEDENENDEEGLQENEDGVDLNINGNNMKIRVNTDGDSANVQVELAEADFATAPGAYGPARRTYNNLSNFEAIEASSAFRVVVRRGDQYRVEAAGREEDLERMEVDVQGGALRIQREGRRSLLPSFNLNEKPILVTVTLPRLRRLELTGACQADVSGFSDESSDFVLEESGACTARIADLRSSRVRLDLSGASRADLSGETNRLDVDGSGVCIINAQGLRAQDASFELSGASTAKTNVEQSLRADLSGSSHVKYRGNPERIEKDLSGASSVKAL